MDARSLLAVLAILFLLWLVKIWANWDSKEKITRNSGQSLRSRLLDSKPNSGSGNLSEVSGTAMQQSVASERSIRESTDTEGITQHKPPASPKIHKTLFQAPSHRDDLKRIKGIGPVMERTLNDLGVTSFSQLASFTQTDIDNVTEAIGSFPGRIERDDWVGKARQFVLDQSTV